MKQKTRPQILERVIYIVSKDRAIPSSEINKKSSFFNDLGADSMAMLMIVMLLEKEFDIRIEEKDIDQLKTVDDVVKYIEKLNFIHIIQDKLGVEESEFVRPDGSLIEEASFSHDLGADSLDGVEIIMDFERVFDMAIPDHEQVKIRTVGELWAYVDY
jgi:acyl carrier protein